MTSEVRYFKLPTTSSPLPVELIQWRCGAEYPTNCYRIGTAFILCRFGGIIIQDRLNMIISASQVACRNTRPVEKVYPEATSLLKKTGFQISRPGMVDIQVNVDIQNDARLVD